jgi:hypothetical protein
VDLHLWLRPDRKPARNQQTLTKESAPVSARQLSRREACAAFMFAALRQFNSRGPRKFTFWRATWAKPLFHARDLMGSLCKEVIETFPILACANGGATFFSLPTYRKSRLTPINRDELKAPTRPYLARFHIQSLDAPTFALLPSRSP